MKMHTTNQACQSDINTIWAGVEPESLLLRWVQSLSVCAQTKSILW